MIGKATVGNALAFRDLSNAEGIRSKAPAARSGACGGETNTWTVYIIKGFIYYTGGCTKIWGGGQNSYNSPNFGK